MNTPPTEILDNELIKEFADRCLSASRSIQGYMVASNPGPDNETMESLIDTNEQLQTALNQHQRSVLSARKQLGLNVRSEETSPAATPAAVTEEVSPLQEPALPVRNGKGKAAEIYQAAASGSGSASASGSGIGFTSGAAAKGKQAQENGTHDDEDPFADPFDDPDHEIHTPNGAASRSRTPANDVLPHEPFHPGFTPAAAAPTGHPALHDEAVGPASAAKQTTDESIEDLYDAAASTPAGKGKSSA